MSDESRQTIRQSNLMNDSSDNTMRHFGIHRSSFIVHRFGDFHGL
jgi:peroxiredoxin